MTLVHARGENLVLAVVLVIESKGPYYLGAWNRIEVLELRSEFRTCCYI